MSRDERKSFSYEKLKIDPTGLRYTLNKVCDRCHVRYGFIYVDKNDDGNVCVDFCGNAERNLYGSAGSISTYW